MVFSTLALWLVIAAILAVGIVVLLIWKRRQERAVNDFSSQIQYLIDEGGAAGRIAPGADPRFPALGFRVVQRGDDVTVHLVVEAISRLRRDSAEFSTGMPAGSE